MPSASGAPAPQLLRRTAAPFQPSAVIETVERVVALRKQGVDVVNLGIGESDLGVPPHVVAATIDALRGPALSSTPPLGGAAVREAVRAWIGGEYGIEVGIDEVMISSGSKLILYQVFCAALDPDDEVIIPTPAWPTIGALVTAVGARPVFVPSTAAQGFTPSASAIAAAIGPRTRMLYLANPANPTGAVFGDAEVEPLVRLCAERGLVLVSDGAYRGHVYEGRAANLPALARAAGVPCVLIDTLSKRYGMSAWRLGLAAAPAELIAAMGAIQAQTITCPPPVSQLAAVAALSGPQACVAEGRAEFGRRRGLMLERLARAPGLDLEPVPAGGFFLFPSVTKLLGRRTPDGATLDTDVALCRHLIDVAHVATVAGTFFGGPGHLRISYTQPLAALEEGCARIVDGLAALR